MSASEILIWEQPLNFEIYPKLACAFEGKKGKGEGEVKSASIFLSFVRSNKLLQSKVFPLLYGSKCWM